MDVHEPFYNYMMQKVVILCMLITVSNGQTCPLGQMWTGSACTECLKGTYASSNTATTCTTCDYGSYASSSGSSACTVIPPATFACIQPGGYSMQCTAWNTSSCNICRSGTYSVVNSTINGCVRCPRGTFSSAAGSTTCLACPQGKYTDADGLSACLTCQSTCEAGYFNSGCGSSSAGSCVACFNTN